MQDIKHETLCFITRWNMEKRVIKIQLAAEYFWRNLRCFIWWWNTVSKYDIASQPKSFQKEKLGIWCKNEQFFIWFPNTKYKFPLYFLYELLMSLRSIIANHSLNISKTKHYNQVGIRYKWALNFSVIIIIS